MTSSPACCHYETAVLTQSAQRGADTRWVLIFASTPLSSQDAWNWVTYKTDLFGLRGLEVGENRVQQPLVRAL